MRSLNAQQVIEAVRLLRPPFFTLEEVEPFLIASMPAAAAEPGSARSSGDGRVRCIWVIVLPLLDMGYQVDIRILNAALYGVPQTRTVRHSLPPCIIMTWMG